MSESAFVKKEPIKVSISVWRETVPESLRSLITNIPKDFNVIAVREPISVTTGNVHYLYGDDHKSDLLSTLRAIARQNNITPREALMKLSQGERYELDYHTKLPFLMAPKTPMSKYTTLSNNDPAVKKILEEAEQLNGGNIEIEKLEDQTRKFHRSKRFAKKLAKLKGGQR